MLLTNISCSFVPGTLATNCHVFNSSFGSTKMKACSFFRANQNRRRQSNEPIRALMTEIDAKASAGNKAARLKKASGLFSTSSLYLLLVKAGTARF